MIRDQRVFISNGGGTTRVEGALLYFYIVANDVGRLESTNSSFGEGKSAFYKIGAQTDHRFCFCVVDLAHDHRLRNELTQSARGNEVFSQISAAAPALVVSKSNLTDLNSLDAVEIAKIDDFDKAIGKISDRIRELEPKEKNKVIKFLREANSVVKLEPNFLGIGVNLNRLLSQLLERIDPK
jgi:hypothetical protein